MLVERNAEGSLKCRALRAWRAGVGCEGRPDGCWGCVSKRGRGLELFDKLRHGHCVNQTGDDRCLSCFFWASNSVKRFEVDACCDTFGCLCIE